MNRDRWLVLCLAYGIGLLSTVVFGFPNSHPIWQQWAIVITGLSGLSCAIALIMPRFWRRGPKKQFWLAMGLVAILAVVYFQMRVPTPSKNDISKLLKGSRPQDVVVEGKTLTEGRLNASQKIRFWFDVSKVKQDYSNSKTGKIYVTLPLSEGKDIYPGQKLTIEGLLYKPSPPDVPGAFNFKAYLARQGVFAGLKGVKITQRGDAPWGLWQIRKRIVKAQNLWLGSPAGPLVSSIVLGRQSVDLPADIQAQFNQAGLAHVLAVSGFQVSLLVGVVVRITRRFSPIQQLIIGIIVLVIYVGLTGIQPSVMRAALMGVGALIGLVFSRKINILGSLLLVAFLLLLFNPLWIWDLGFQLSFLATFGLIVTMPALQNKLDWLPPTIATLIAIPIAASLWTLPLLMQVFSVLATYSIFCNIITAPLVTIISLGGMVSAGVALIFPLGGSAIAFLLYYPTKLLIAIVVFFNHLPGSSYAVGKLPVELMLLIYALLIVVWLNKWFQKYLAFIGLIILTLVIIPLTIIRLNLVQVTVLESNPQPVIIIQERGKVVLFNGGDATTEKYSLLPFLAQQGVNKIDVYVQLNQENNKVLTDSYLSIKRVFKIAKQEDQINAGIELLKVTPPIFQFTVNGQKWIWLTQGTHNLDNISIQSPHVLLWTGKELNPISLEQIKPKIVVFIAPFVDKKTKRQLQQQRIKLYWTGKNGVIQWTPNNGFRTNLVTDIPE